MSARVDTSELTTVVWCTACTWWSVLTFNVATGHDIAVQHEEAVHPDSRQAERNRNRWQQRELRKMTRQNLGM